MASSRPYSVWCPDFDVTSGGIRVLYGLIGWLLTRGQIVIPNAQGPEFITIYPDVIKGNPFNSGRVVWYLLNAPGVMGMGGVKGETEFDPKHKIFVFSELYNTVGVDEQHIMFLPILDLHLFKVTNRGKRKHKCKSIGKGKDLHLKKTEGLFEVDRPFAKNQARLAEYLNECEVMYSYDNNSAMFEVARLCGCRVVIIPSIDTRDQFKKYEPGMNGIAYGIKEDGEYGAKLDADYFRKWYLGLRSRFMDKLDYFIEETQLWPEK